MNTEKNQHTCLICQTCGREFTGYPNQLFCSNACYRKSLAEDVAFRALGSIRRQKFEAALRYVERHNLKEIFKKYRNKSEMAA